MGLKIDDKIIIKNIESIKEAVNIVRNNFASYPHMDIMRSGQILNKAVNYDNYDSVIIKNCRLDNFEKQSKLSEQESFKHQNR